MTQSGREGGGDKNTLFSVTLYNFHKYGGAIALPAPPPSAVPKQPVFEGEV